MWTPYQQFARIHFPELCQERPVNSHKGTFGTVAIIGGNTGMSGAAIIAARAALKMGAGKVKIGFAQDSLPLPVGLFTSSASPTHRRSGRNPCSVAARPGA